jgi:hypothetical protein
MGLDKPATGPGLFGWPIKAQARRRLPLTIEAIECVGHRMRAELGTTVGALYRYLIPDISEPITEIPKEFVMPL